MVREKKTGKAKGEIAIGVRKEWIGINGEIVKEKKKGIIVCFLNGVLSPLVRTNILHTL